MSHRSSPWVVLVLLALLFDARSLPAQECPSVQEMIDDGIAELISRMEGPNSNYWTSFHPVPAGTIGFALVTTAICVEAIAMGPGYTTAPDSQARQDAVRRATGYLLANHQAADCSDFGPLMLLRCFLFLQKTGRVPGGLEMGVDNAIRSNLITKLINCNSYPFLDCPPPPQPVMYGYFYGNVTQGQLSWGTSQSLLVLKEAQSQGYTWDARQQCIIDRAIDVLSRARISDGVSAGGFTYQNALDAYHLPNRAVLPGSIQRNPLCQTALLDWSYPANVPIGEHKARVRAAVDKFLDGTLPGDPSTKTYSLLIAHKGTGGHGGPYEIAEYYFMAGHHHTGMAIEHLDPADRPERRAKLAKLLRSCRDYDGTWSDSTLTPPDMDVPHLYPLNKNYGTAAAILALSMPYIYSQSTSNATIQGKLVHDQNANGILEGTEPRLAGWSICLKSEDESVHQHATTSGTGNYSFTAPKEKYYVITPTLQQGWQQTFPPAGNRLGIKRGSWNGASAEYADLATARIGSRDFALIGHHGGPGVDIVDVTVACTPAFVGTWTGSGNCMSFEDIAVKGSLGFFASEGGCGVVIVDLGPLAAGQLPLQRAVINASTPACTGIGEPGTNTAHTIWIEGDLLFVADSRTDRLRVFHIGGTPAQPVVSCVTGIRSDDSTADIHDLCIHERRLYACKMNNNAAGGVEIFDIGGMLDNPLGLNSGNPGYERLGNIDGLKGAHSCWTTEDGRYLVVAQERPPWSPWNVFDVTIWDVSDPANACLVTTIESPKLQAANNAIHVENLVAYCPHNPVVVGNSLYVSWYQAGAFVFDISNPEQPCRPDGRQAAFSQNVCELGTYPAGHFDTTCEPMLYADENENPQPLLDYGGNWGINPFLGEDRILATDMENGLFILSSSGRSHEVRVMSENLTNRDFGVKNLAGADCNQNTVPDGLELARSLTLLSDRFGAASFPPPGWSASGSWHSTQWCFQGGGNCSPDEGAAYFGRDTDCDAAFGARTAGDLSAPRVWIPAGATAATLRYCSAYCGRAGSALSSGSDWAWVEVNGVKVDDVSGTGSACVTDPNVGYPHDRTVMSERTIDLIGYAGQSVLIKWRFDSVDAGSSDSLGWQVAAVKIEAQVANDCNSNSIPDECDGGYRLVDIGTFGGTTSMAQDINAFGDVVGYATAGSNQRAFLWRDLDTNGITGAGEMVDLGTLGGTYSNAFAINNLGAVTGYAMPAGGLQRAFLWQDANCNGTSESGEMVDLGTLPGDTGGTAYDVNDQGDIVGHTRHTIGAAHAFVRRNGQMISLGTLGGSYSYAYGINATGQVCGYSSNSSNYARAFRWESGVGMVNLGTLGPNQSVNVYGYDINDAGHVAGHSPLTGGDDRAFLWNGSTMINLGDLGGRSYARGINNLDEVVGNAYVGTTSHAFIWSQGVMRDLHALVPACSGWVLTLAYAINDSGHIVGYGMLNGKTRAFLLEPIP